MKISTLPPLCLMIYCSFLKYKKYKKIEIPKKIHIPLLGVAPRDPRAWPLEAQKGLTKGQKATIIFFWHSLMVTIRYKMVLVQFYALLAYFVTGGATASERPLCYCG